MEMKSLYNFSCHVIESGHRLLAQFIFFIRTRSNFSNVAALMFQVEEAVRIGLRTAAGTTSCNPVWDSKTQTILKYANLKIFKSIFS